MKITHRLAIDHLTKENKYQQLALNVSDMAQGADFSELLKTGTLSYKRLYGAIDGLSIDHKEVIMLFYWQDFSCSQIAQILCCSSGTVKSRLFTAREILEKKQQITSYRKEMINE